MLIGIVGGGLSGLTFQRFLKADSEILEKEVRIGGLCRTFEKDSFKYDIGGHILFSKEKEFLLFVRTLLDANIVHQRRANKILFKGNLIKYPFENALGELSKEDTYECLLGYFQGRTLAPANFEEWMYYAFGSGIVEKYLLPYNKKIWKFPLDQMSMDWVGRVPRPPLEDIVKSAVGISTEGHAHQLYFDYPRHGGIEALPRAIKRADARIQTGFEVRRICRINNQWVVSDESQCKRYDKLVLTMPLDRAIACMENVPTEVMTAIKGLRYNPVRIVMIGIRDRTLMDKTAIYMPDPSVVAHRICYMGRFSETTVPDGKSSLMAEISAPLGHPLSTLSNEAMIERVIEDCVRAGLFIRESVVTYDIQNISHGYVVYDLQYQHKLKIVRQYFDSLGIELLGRFAEFEYINMDEAIRRAKARAEAWNMHSPTENGNVA